MSINMGVRDLSKLALGGAIRVRPSWLAYGRQTIEDDDIQAVAEALRSDWLTQGPRIADFEGALAQVSNTAYCVAMSSGTAALHAAFYALGVTKGDEVILPGMSFAATANAVLYLGARPVFADIDATTGNVSPSSVKALISSNTKAVVGVDYAGQPCLVEDLKLIAENAGLPLVVDGSHSLGATIKGTPSAALADITTFSFHPVKLITTGEGGAIVTNDSSFAKAARRFRTHGITKDVSDYLKPDEGPWYHEMQDLGFNYRITDFQAALGLSQLKKLPRFLSRRREIAAIYRAEIGELRNFECLAEVSETSSAHHLFPILVTKSPYADNRRFVVEALHAENIGVQVHYMPIYRHPYYQSRQIGADCPRTDSFYEKVLSIPMYAGMRDSDVEDVLNALRRLDEIL
jgi:perosamine synthetase